MRSGGSNNKPDHIEDISLCGLFLMEVAKKVDIEFGAHCTSSHTTADASTDISKIADYLMESEVIIESAARVENVADRVESSTTSTEVGDAAGVESVAGLESRVMVESEVNEEKERFTTTLLGPNRGWLGQNV